MGYYLVYWEMVIGLFLIFVRFFNSFILMFEYCVCCGFICGLKCFGCMGWKCDLLKLLIVILRSFIVENGRDNCWWLFLMLLLVILYLMKILE